MALDDPNTEVQRAQSEALRALGVEGRLRVAESLRAFAWEIKTAMLVERNPGLPPAAIADRVREALGGGRV